MRLRTAAAVGSAVVAAAVVVVVLVSSGGSGTSPTPDGPAAGPQARDAVRRPATHPRGAIADCSTRSEAHFPGAFSDRDNLVVGPLVLVGATYTPASTVREFGGNKFPALVRAGHTVTVQLPRSARSTAELGWTQGRRRVEDHTTTFVACRAGRPSGSSANGPVTFWSGGVGSRTIGCVPLRIYVDDEPSPRRVALALGRPCREPSGRDDADRAAPRNAAVVACAHCTRNNGRHLEVGSPRNVRAGPAILYHARQYADAPQSEFAPVRPRGDLRDDASPAQRREIREGPHYWAEKILLLIAGRRSVTLEIPPAERAHASLLYAGKRRYSAAEKDTGLAEISDGHAAVRLKPHRRGRGRFTEIPGGLVVAGARCLPLDVWVEGRATPIRRTLSFGMGDVC